MRASIFMCNTVYVYTYVYTVKNQLSANQLSANSVNRKTFSVSTIFEFQVEHQIFFVKFKFQIKLRNS